MVLLARRAAQLCTKRYASQPHDPRTLRARRLVSTNKSNTKQDPYTLSGGWSFLQRANPFTVWGETIGREPSDRLPKVTDLVKAVVGLSGKSPDELQRYATESNAAFEAYVDDLGFERRSLLEIAPKDEEQSLDEFLEGARDAVAFVAPRLKDAVAHEAELSKVVSAQLLNKAKEGSIATSLVIQMKVKCEGSPSASSGLGCARRTSRRGRRAPWPSSSKFCRSGATPPRRGTTLYC